MEHLLFAGYLILFTWLVTKIGFFTRSGLSPSLLIIVFLLKVMAGIFYGWIGILYSSTAQMVDTWYYHKESLIEHGLLLQDPKEFVASLFRSTYANGYGGFIGGESSWWNDLHTNFLIKALALCNVLTFGNYYTNVIFYSFLTLWGPMALYRVMKDVFPGREIAVLAATFLVPSFIYWTSGIHKDGILFTGLAIVIYHFYFGLKETRFQWWRLLPIAAGLLLIIIIRNYVIVVLLPALLAWVVARKVNRKPFLTFAVIYALFIICFFTAQYIFPKVNLPYAVVEKQQQFLRLHGNSAVPIKELQPHFASFLQNIPQAFSLSSIRPYPSDVKHLLSMAASVEINLLLLFVLLFLIWPHPVQNLSKPFILFCVFFSFSLLITIGYTVNFLGAIVRYRSVVLPLLMVPVIAQTNWSKIAAFTKNIKTNINI